MKKNSVKRTNGTKDAASRYSKLKEELDSDLFNSQWRLVNTEGPLGINKKYNFIDLFSGAGGLSLGFSQANYEKLLSSEIDPDAAATNERNFPKAIHFTGPIEKVSDRQILDAVGNKTVHVVCGGPPCQGFSVAGLRNPKDPRNVMFKEFVRVVSLVKPWFVLLENVPGILTMSGGAVKNAIIAEFDQIGYRGMSVRILEAATYGVPQLRTRAIFIANRFNLVNPYPKEIYAKEQYKAIESVILDLKDHPRDPKINHEWTEHSKEYEERIAKVPPGGSLYETFRDAFKRQYLGVPAMTIKENHGGTHIHPVLNRVISAREMARLQTFPDNFIFEGRMKRVMWQVGNAVPVLFAKHLALALRDGLREAEKILSKG
ncbi:MAG: DNA cytosine methyltransferase [Candidatus Babeliales bacterium]